MELVLRDRGEHPHGNVDEPEGDRPGPDRARHGDLCAPPGHLPNPFLTVFSRIHRGSSPVFRAWRASSSMNRLDVIDSEEQVVYQYGGASNSAGSASTTSTRGSWPSRTPISGSRVKLHARGCTISTSPFAFSRSLSFLPLWEAVAVRPHARPARAAARPPTTARRSTRSSTQALVCHLGFVHDGQPYVIPTLLRRGWRRALRPRLVGEPDAADARRRRGCLPDRDAGRRARPRALGLQPLGQLPVGGRARPRRAVGGPTRSCARSSLQRAAAARALGGGPAADRERAEGDLDPRCRSTRPRRRSAPGRRRTTTTTTTGPRGPA